MNIIVLILYRCSTAFDARGPAIVELIMYGGRAIYSCSVLRYSKRVCDLLGLLICIQSLMQRCFTALAKTQFAGRHLDRLLVVACSSSDDSYAISLRVCAGKKDGAAWQLLLTEWLTYGSGLIDIAWSVTPVQVGMRQARVIDLLQQHCRTMA